MGGGDVLVVNKVLLVDDHSTQLNIWSRACKARKKLPLRASHHDEAIALARREKPELALVDVFLAGRDGLEVTRGLKRIDPRMHVVVLSGEMTPELALHAVLAGADDCYCKLVLAGPIIDAVERGARVQGAEQWLATDTGILNRVDRLLAAHKSLASVEPGAPIRTLSEHLDETELRVIGEMLDRTNDNALQTAKLLKTSRQRVSKVQDKLRSR